MVSGTGTGTLRRVIQLPVILIGFVLAGALQEVSAQDALVAIEENLRAQPGGDIIARLTPGMRVSVAASEGNWSQVTIEGFVWSQSLQVRTSGNYDLIVAESEGENLRTEPSGEILARLNSGTLLDELERIPGWIRVRRTAWIWTASLTFPGSGTASATAPSTPAAPAPSGSATRQPAVGEVPAGGSEGDGVQESLTLPEGPEVSTEGWVRSGSAGTRILAGPDGDVLGRIEPGADLRIVAREGNWARVQVDGWAWIPTFPVGSETVGDPTILRGVEAGDLSANFDRYRGRIVELELQFISLERAEQVRSDFYPGEPFLLTRALDEARTFVYIAVPEGRLAEVRSLAPLERILITGRARSGAAVFTGSPILDLLELMRAR